MMVGRDLEEETVKNGCLEVASHFSRFAARTG
jgi:hypothetical protein